MWRRKSSANPFTYPCCGQVHWTIGLVAVFYGLVMALGYTYGVCTGDVSDNILNDFG